MAFVPVGMSMAMVPVPVGMMMSVPLDILGGGGLSSG